MVRFVGAVTARHEKTGTSCSTRFKLLGKACAAWLAPAAQGRFGYVGAIWQAVGSALPAVVPRFGPVALPNPSLEPTRSGKAHWPPRPQ
jgi:hypothetical protein